MTTTMTIRLDEDVRDRLERIAEATHRSKSWLTAEAIHDFVNTNERQIREIQAGLREAEAGEFATVEQVATLVAKWNGVTSR